MSALGPIPAFLDRRIPTQKDTVMTATPPAAPAKAPRQKRQDAYVGRLVMPFDPKNFASLQAVSVFEAKIRELLPEGATLTGGIGKVAAE